MISEVHNFSSFSWMISTIVSYYIFLSPGMLAISSRILPPLTTCFYVEETETGIEESLAQFCIDYSQAMLLSYKCKISWCSYLNISLKVRC